MHDYPPIREYETTGNRLVRVYFDNTQPDPFDDPYIAPECKVEMHDLWAAGEVYYAEVFPKDIALLDYEAGRGVEYMCGFYGEDGPESYFPNINQKEKSA